MKILAINLLRLGDVMMSSGVLKALKEKYPRAELHLLINQQCAGVAPLLPFVDRFIYFDRARAQEGLGEFENPLCDSYDYLKNFIGQINSENYDTIFSFSQNLFTGRLLGLLKAREKIGMIISDPKTEFTSPWFEKLNRRQTSEPMHYVDYLARASGVAGNSVRPALFAKPGVINKPNSSYVIVQALTSDVKKNWNIDSYVSMVRSMSLQKSDLNFIFLAAPNEKNLISHEVKEMRDAGIHVELRVCDLSEALQLIQGASLVISGDTSIKHLASATPTPILEISLGSSDFYFTGAYSSAAYIVQSQVSCAPCSHSGQCPLSRRVCADAIHPQVVAQIALRIMGGESLQHFDDLLHVTFLRNGTWSAQELNANNNFDFYEETVRGIANEL